VFMLGFPFKIMFGLISLAILLPLMSSVFAYVFDMMQRDILILVRWFA
jgi:flagellar biosynthetic protein FliR